MNLGDRLAALTVLDEASRPVALGTFWSDQTAVIAWVRQFG